MQKDTPSTSEENKDSQVALKRFVMESGLSVRATNVLLANVGSLEELNLMDENILSSFQNCGRKTIQEIQSFVHAIRFQEGVQALFSTKKLLSAPPIKSTIALLPIFSNTRLADVTIKNLHLAFCAEVEFKDIPLSRRISNTLNHQLITMVGEVMLTPYSVLLTWKNFGKKSINELKEVVLSLCLTGSYSPYNEKDEAIIIDYSSYEDMVSSFTAVCVKKKRNQELFQKRFCFQTEKVPTLEELGQAFGITRERVRQIVNKGARKFKHRVNMDKLERFWEKIDRVVASGGGVIHLGELSSALQKNFNWPTAPHPLALGQLLNLRGSNSGNKDIKNLITADCDCPYCDKVLERINDLDLLVNESYHIEVLALKLKDYCQAHCPNQEPVITFHRAFIENLINRTDGDLILYEDIVMSRNKWLEKYCNKLEDVICHLLENHCKPMHFSEIASQVRKQNINFQEISDHNVHASIARYGKIKIANRGTYGLKSWEFKDYRSVSTAIEEFLDAKSIPQRRQHIIQHLDGEFADANITAALSTETRFKSIGEGIYDRQQNWKKRTLDDLIKRLPVPVAEFARYLTGRNNTSYKLVMAFIFIRSMDDQGAIYLFKLKNMFYNFYLSRYKKGLVVEIDSAAMSHIGELSKTEIKNRTCKEPLKSFMKSHYFVRYSQNGRRIKLVDRVFSGLDSASTRDNLLIVILKAIDHYFQMISPEIITYIQSPKMYSKNRKSVSEENSLFSADPMNNATTTLNIKKKRRGKIRL